MGCAARLESCRRGVLVLIPAPESLLCGERERRGPGGGAMGAGWGEADRAGYACGVGRGGRGRIAAIQWECGVLLMGHSAGPFGCIRRNAIPLDVPAPTIPYFFTLSIKLISYNLFYDNHESKI